MATKKSIAIQRRTWHGVAWAFGVSWVLTSFVNLSFAHPAKANEPGSFPTSAATGARGPGQTPLELVNAPELAQPRLRVANLPVELKTEQSSWFTEPTSGQPLPQTASGKAGVTSPGLPWTVLLLILAVSSFGLRARQLA